MNFNWFNFESKDSMRIEIKGEMTSQDAEKVSQTIAEGKRFFIKCVGVALILAVIGYFVLQIMQKAA